MDLLVRTQNATFVCYLKPNRKISRGYAMLDKFGNAVCRPFLKKFPFSICHVQC